MELNLPNRNLLDLMVAFSFYKTCPGSKVSFVSPTRAKIAWDGDAAESICKELIKFKNDADKGVLFGIQWVPKSSAWKYDVDSFMRSENSRAYAHEFMIKEEKKNEGKSHKPLEYVRSPLVMLSRGITYINYDKKICGDIKRKLSTYINLSNIQNFLVGNYQEIATNDELVKRKRHKKPRPYNGSSYGFSPTIVPDGSNYKFISPAESHPIKDILSLFAVSLFESYVSNKRIVVDGNEKDLLIIPLSSKPLNLEDFRLLHRCPYIKKYWKHLDFWKEQGIVDFNVFIKRAINKETYFELRS